jgi:3,4-dihydroxy-2-butanone 4-phosphate synthase
MNTPLSQIISDFSAGKFVLVLDEHREKEGDFFCLAETVTKEQVNFLFQHGHGQICVACAPEILERLQIPPMVTTPTDVYGTNFTVSVDAAQGITTGVSANDRVTTMKILADPNAKPITLLRPGHTFPLRAKNPKERWGHTEAAVELAKIAGKTPAVVICEILNKDGEKSSREELTSLANQFNIATTTLENLKKIMK